MASDDDDGEGASDESQSAAGDDSRSMFFDELRERLTRVMPEVRGSADVEMVSGELSDVGDVDAGVCYDGCDADDEGDSGSVGASGLGAGMHTDGADQGGQERDEERPQEQ